MEKEIIEVETSIEDIKRILSELPPEAFEYEDYRNSDMQSSLIKEIEGIIDEFGYPYSLGDLVILAIITQNSSSHSIYARITTLIAVVVSDKLLGRIRNNKIFRVTGDITRINAREKRVVELTEKLTETFGENVEEKSFADYVRNIDEPLDKLLYLFMYADSKVEYFSANIGSIMYDIIQKIQEE